MHGVHLEPVLYQCRPLLRHHAAVTVRHTPQQEAGVYHDRRSVGACRLHHVSTRLRLAGAGPWGRRQRVSPDDTSGLRHLLGARLLLRATCRHALCLRAHLPGGATERPPDGTSGLRGGHPATSATERHGPAGEVHRRVWRRGLQRGKQQLSAGERQADRERTQAPLAGEDEQQQRVVPPVPGR